MSFSELLLKNHNVCIFWFVAVKTDCMKNIRFPLFLYCFAFFLRGHTFFFHLLLFIFDMYY